MIGPYLQQILYLTLTSDGNIRVEFFELMQALLGTKLVIHHYYNNVKNVAKKKYVRCIPPVHSDSIFRDKDNYKEFGQR